MVSKIRIKVFLVGILLRQRNRLLRVDRMDFNKLRGFIMGRMVHKGIIISMGSGPRLIIIIYMLKKTNITKRVNKPI